MSDAVDRLIEEREAMDHGMEGGFVLSVTAHVLLIAGSIVGPMLMPKDPPLRVADGFAVPLPPGGGGARTPDPAPAAATEATQPPPAPEPPPKLIKPPSSKAEPKTKGLPAPDAKKTTKKPKQDDTRRVADAPPNPASKPAPAAGAAGGAGKSGATPGFDFGPPGPGVPTGTDMLGDWYLAGVQRKIWSIWMQQIKTDFTQPITVRFTILQDGTLGEVTVVQSSGSTLLDLAAKRAIYSAAPFGPLPKTYATTSYTIQGIFRPTQ